jgi:hypothetical protein
MQRPAGKVKRAHRSIRARPARRVPSPRRGEGQDEGVRDSEFCSEVRTPSPQPSPLWGEGVRMLWRGANDRERSASSAGMIDKARKVHDSYMAFRNKISAWSRMSIQQAILEARG